MSSRNEEEAGELKRAFSQHFVRALDSFYPVCSPWRHPVQYVHNTRTRERLIKKFERNFGPLNSLDGGAANVPGPDRDLVELRAADVVSRGVTNPCERSQDKGAK